MLLVSGKEMAVQKLPSLLMPPIKERPFPYYSSEPRNSKVQPWQFKTKQTSLALLPTNSWIILIRSIRNRWKLGGLHLEEGKMFCFTFFLSFLSMPQSLHNLFRVNHLLCQPHTLPLIYRLSAMHHEQPCNKSLSEEYRLVFVVLSSAASTSWRSTGMNPLWSCSMGGNKLCFTNWAKGLE